MQSIRRIAICLQYEGTSFCGWQRQPSNRSVQEVLEHAIEQLDPYRPVRAIAAGRTDAGVHAAGQVVHFDCCGSIPIHRWSAALNGRLPESIRVREAVNRPYDWHACRSAVYRRYRYILYNGQQPNLFLARWSWHRSSTLLDEQSMQAALQGLLGLHDFSAFQKAGSYRSHAYTTVQEVSVERRGDLIEIEIQASGFLYGMVRLLVGQLVAVGEHRLSVENFDHSWRKWHHSQARKSAPPQGLCLLRAGYMEELFENPGWYDSQARFLLSYRDPPSLTVPRSVPSCSQ
ncbi:tRNA pseudouridine(38-40) synthase TruA [cyanobiont of Ornithocercus magnificus]|nr:tRNA pseudouridine(38-40) synthase TruA [cyanobiont of Ornithocercus magnificus]